MNAHKVYMGLLAAALLAGCAQFNVTGPQEDEPVYEISTNGVASRAAVCIGLRYVNAAGYQGWDGDCPGCDVDAKSFYTAFTSRGILSTLLLNSAATWEGVKTSVMAAAKSVTAGDLLIITISGHGGHFTDLNGDEVDRLDETWVLWDKQVRDDTILTELFLQLPDSIKRVALISDQCYSENNFRSLVLRPAIRFLTLGKYGHKVYSAQSVTRQFVRSKGGDLQIIQLASSRETQSSLGSEPGGVWSLSMLKNLAAAPTWRAWFNRSAVGMPATQTPVWSEYGPVSDAFRNAPPLR